MPRLANNTQKRFATDVVRCALTDIFLNTHTVEATINLNPSVRERLTPGGGKPFTKHNVFRTPHESRTRDHNVEFPLSYKLLLPRAVF